MGVGLYLIGRSKRPPGELAGALERWFQDRSGGVLEQSRITETADGPTVALKLHPAAEDLELALQPGGKLSASAKTSTVGPGYHVYVCEALRELAGPLGVTWEERDLAGGTGDETGYFHGGRRADVEREMQKWIAHVAARVLELPAGTMRIALSLPADRAFDGEGHVLTPLGPRDTAWLKKAAADGAAARDFFPWWEEGLGPDYQLGRALTLMWTDVRWRAPLDQAEKARLELVTRLLEEAHRMDASLDYPWREWAELLGYLGKKSSPLHDILVRRGARQAPGRPLVGYRRKPVTVSLSGGWRLTIPGSFAESWDAAGTFLAGEPPRSLWVSAFHYKRDDDSPVPAEELLAAPPAEAAGAEKLELGADAAAAGLVGRAFLRRAGEGAEAHWELAGETAVLGSLANCTITFEHPGDRDWAVATWRSLVNDGSRAE